MAYSETQLQTWSHQGSTAQSAATYDTIKRVLENRSAPYSSRSFEIFLQGSYGNDTNIYSDSDVDIVICLTSVYYDDLEALDQSQRQTYDAQFSPATYSWRAFRNEVLAWLRHNFGSAVVDGKKAILINGGGQRRDADVLVCAEHRRYFSFYSATNYNFAKGVVFWTSAGTMIVNFPKQHHDNCVAKHQNSSFRFKPNVRILKNYRNALVSSGKLSAGVAPSYFVEGLLWNMPNARFQGQFVTTVSNFVDWIRSVDSTELLCANELYYLVRDNSPVCWPRANFQTYIAALAGDW